jgi:IS1 family transposase
VNDLEIDEFWSFVGAKKRRRQTWRQFDRRRRKVVALVIDGHLRQNDGRDDG